MCVRACMCFILNHKCEGFHVLLYEVARVPGVACMNPSEKGEGLVRAGIIPCRKSMYFLPGL